MKIIKKKSLKKNSFGTNPFNNLFLTNSVYAYESHIPVGGNIALLIIDPQNDFINGSLAVPGAMNDMLNTISFIEENLSRLSEIVVSLDTHNKFHIAHPLYWVDKNGKSPKAFEKIEKTISDWNTLNFEGYKTTREEFHNDALKYLKKDSITIWPEHCLLGTNGHLVYPPLAKVLGLWEEKHVKSVRYITKGCDAKTEQYSAFKSVMPFTTKGKLNTTVLSSLKTFNRILVCGEALTHCVRFSLEDLLSYIGGSGGDEAEVYLLKDCTSGIKGYSLDFLKELQNKYPNFKVTKSTDALVQLRKEESKIIEMLSSCPDMLVIKQRIDKFKSFYDGKKNTFESAKINNCIVPLSPYEYKNMPFGKNKDLPYWGPNFRINLYIVRNNKFKNKLEYLSQIGKNKIELYLPGSFLFDNDQQTEGEIINETFNSLITRVFKTRPIDFFINKRSGGSGGNGGSGDEIVGKVIYTGLLNTYDNTSNSWIITKVYKCVVNDDKDAFIKSDNISNRFMWTDKFENLSDSNREMLIKIKEIKVEE